MIGMVTRSGFRVCARPEAARHRLSPADSIKIFATDRIGISVCTTHLRHTVALSLSVVNSEGPTTIVALPHVVADACAQRLRRAGIRLHALFGEAGAHLRIVENRRHLSRGTIAGEVAAGATIACHSVHS